MEPEEHAEGLPWWVSQRARLAVLLVCLAVLVSYLVATRTGLVGLGGATSSDAATGMWAPGCPLRKAPAVADMAPEQLVGLREGLRRIVLGPMPRRLYRGGTVTSENAWSDNFPEPVTEQRFVSTQLPGAYEMRWWTTHTDLVGDVFVFSQVGQARAFFDLATSPRCRAQGAQLPTSSPPGAIDLEWRNPDDVRQQDVFLLRGKQVYRVSDVRYEQQGITRQSTERRLGFSIANGLACALPEAGCAEPQRQRRLALASLAQR